MLKPIGFMSEEEVPCLFSYAGKLGQTKNTTDKYTLFSVLKKYKLFEF